MTPRDHGRPGTAPLRILVVDDNADGAEALCAVLTAMGCETCVAFDGAHGWVAAQAFDPGLVFLDLEMPDMSGCDLARRFRAAPVRSAARLVCLTGHGHAEDERLCMAAGFDDFFTKPIRLESLLAVVAAANAAAPSRPNAVT